MTQTLPGSAAPSGTATGDPERISGGHLVAKALKAEGIDTIFTLCGGHIIGIYDGCVDEGISVVDVRHEQVAAHAADGDARVTGVMLGGYGEQVRDPADIGPALRRTRESDKPPLINVWVDPDVYAPGTMNQTMYK